MNNNKSSSKPKTSNETPVLGSITQKNTEYSNPTFKAESNSNFNSPENTISASKELKSKMKSSELKLIKNVEDKIKINKQEVYGLSYEPLILECKKLIVLVRNICARKGILLLEEIKNIDKDDLGVISTNRMGFILETLVGLSGKQIKTLLGFFDSFKFGYVNIKDFCVCLRDENLLKEVALKIGNKIDKIKMDKQH